MTLYSPTRAQLAAIPAQLKEKRQFVLWRGRDRANHPGKLDKIPINPYDLEHASTTDALTWGTFDQCVAALETALEGWHAADPTGYRGGGIGYVFTTDDPYVGIDLDGCVNDVTWVVEAWAQEYVEKLKSYTEVTPSQTGLHILAEGSLPPGGRRKGAVEMYSEGRFFTLTGWHLDGTPETIEPRHKPLEDVWAQLFGPKGDQPSEDTGTAASAPTPSMPDSIVIMKLSRAKNSEKFIALMEGKWKELGYPSPSEGDLALCGSIRFYTQDPLQIDRLFRQSGMMRPKWDERRRNGTYGEQTIRNALAEPHEQYTPPPSLTGIVARRLVTVNGVTAEPGSMSWGKAPVPPPKIKVTDYADMIDQVYPTPKWLVQRLVPEGLIFIIGSPKSSKTYLGYSLALATCYQSAHPAGWLDTYHIVNPGPVVYITLEDDEGDSQDRVRELAPWITKTDRKRLLFVHGHNFPRFNEGLDDVIETQLIQPYSPSMIVMDPISYLYSPIKRGGDQFLEVRDMLLPLRWLGRQYHCTIMGVDHRRKKTVHDIDIFETQYGSTAKGAIADSMFVIVRDDKEVTVHARVRKAPDQTLSLGFEFPEPGRAVWTWKGAVDGLIGQGQYGDLRHKVIEALSGSQIPLSVKDILFAINVPDSKQTRNSIHQILFRAQKAQEVQKTTKNQYVWAGGN